MFPRLLARFRGVFMGLSIGFGVAVLLVTWTDEGVYVKEKLVNYNMGE